MLVNTVVEALRKLSPETIKSGDLVADSHDLLQAVVDRIAVPGPARFPERPFTPLSASALLVNGRDPAANRQ